MKALLYTIIISTVICILFGCSSEPKMGTVLIDSTEIPTMVTRDVDMLISDSGVIKYKAITPIWYVFENNAANKYWYFPEGLHLDQIDADFKPEMSIDADTAYNYETKQLWHLIKNVKVHTAAGEDFRTNELFWDQRRHEVFSDSFIHIERPDAIIEGYGFKSNDAFTKYEIRRTSGIFPFVEKKVERDSTAVLSTDSVASTDSTYFNQAVTDSIMDERVMRGIDDAKYKKDTVYVYENDSTDLNDNKKQ